MERITCEVYEYSELSEQVREVAYTKYLEDVIPALWGVIADDIRDQIKYALSHAGIEVKDGPYYDLYRGFAGGNYTLSLDLDEADRLHGDGSPCCDPLSSLLNSVLGLVDEVRKAGGVSVYVEYGGSDQIVRLAGVEVLTREGEAIEAPADVVEAAKDVGVAIERAILSIVEKTNEFYESEEEARRFFEDNTVRFFADGTVFGGADCDGPSEPVVIVAP